MMSAEYLAAVTYADMGLHVVPCGPDKVARVKWGKQPVTPEKVRQWWTSWPHALIGMVCGPSGIIAIDVDVKDGRDGWGTIDALMRKHGELPGTRTSETPTGGVHLLYRAPDGFEFGPSAGQLGEGVDIRGGVSYVILPPSKAEHGEYTWLVDQRTTVLPEAWAKALQKRKRQPVQTARPVLRDPRKVRNYGTKVLSEETDKVAAAQPGTRNNTITTCAFRVGRVADQCGITSGQAEESFAWAANQWGDTAEARKAADSFWRAFEAGRNEPRELEIRHG
jgi:hypothetical protein